MVGPGLTKQGLSVQALAGSEVEYTRGSNNNKNPPQTPIPCLSTRKPAALPGLQGLDQGTKRQRKRALAGVAQWTEGQPVKQSVSGSIPSQGTCLGYQPGPQEGSRDRQSHTDVSFPLSRPSPLKITLKKKHHHHPKNQKTQVVHREKACSSN